MGVAAGGSILEYAIATSSTETSKVPPPQVEDRMSLRCSAIEA